MSIELRCESCGKMLRAPESMGGKQAECPACKHPMYVPLPPAEIEELPLAPEDAMDARREALLRAEQRRLDSLLAREVAEEPGSHGAGPVNGGDAGETAGSGTRVEKALEAYLMAMRNSDLDGAERAISVLRLQSRAARDLLDRVAADPVPPPSMAALPAGVYQGFLKNLRSKL